MDWQLLNRVILDMESACANFDEHALLGSINILVPELHHIKKELPENVIHMARHAKLA